MLINNINIPTTYKGRYGLWRMINILVFSTLIFATAFTFYFVYQNIYSTLANAHAIITLRSNMTIFDLDMPAYERARLAIMQKKQTDLFPSNTRNIFSYSVISTSTYANTNTPR